MNSDNPRDIAAMVWHDDEDFVKGCVTHGAQFAEERYEDLRTICSSSFHAIATVGICI